MLTAVANPKQGKCKLDGSVTVGQLTTSRSIPKPKEHTPEERCRACDLRRYW